MRRVLVLIYALIFVDEVALLGIVPVLPVYTDQLGLTKSQAGLLLSAASLSIVIVSIPAGRLADRIGARRMTIAASTLIIVSMALQGAATGFVSLMGARLVFGCASGTLWAAGVSWLTDTAPEHRRASTLGAVVPVAGLGGMLGPLYTGVVTHHASARVAFVGIALAAVAVTAGLLLTPSGPPTPAQPPPLGRAVRVAYREHWIAAGIMIVLLGGLADGVVNLLAPLELTAEGFTSASTGVVLSIAAGLFIVSSAVATHRPRRLVSARAAGVAVLLQAASLGLVLANIAAGTGGLDGARTVALRRLGVHDRLPAERLRRASDGARHGHPERPAGACLGRRQLRRPAAGGCAGRERRRSRRLPGAGAHADRIRAVAPASPGRSRRTGAGPHPGAVILAVDQGTTGTTCLVVDPELRVAGRGYREIAQSYPRPGWVEHDPEEIWRTVVDGAARRCARRESRPATCGDRDHQPAGDGGALGPRDRPAGAPGDRVAGPADGGGLPAAAGGADPGAHRAGARPVLLGDQAPLAARRTPAPRAGSAFGTSTPG